MPRHLIRRGNKNIKINKNFKFVYPRHLIRRGNKNIEINKNFKFVYKGRGRNTN
jgi:hypothetical protein